MCGIYGIVSLSGAPLSAPEAAGRLGAGLGHRGPDAHGFYRCRDGVIGAHRLRVRDLTPAADQPFSDPGERVRLVCNGEIDNSASLRARYGTYPFRSSGDIEAILPLYLERGPDGLAQLDGMFALALWEAPRRRLVLARDGAGEKPLFYAIVAGEIVFASEIHALFGYPGLTRRLDTVALEDFLTLGCVREPRTMLADIRRVPAGTVAVFTARETDLRRIEEAASDEPPPSVAALRTELSAVVERQVATDVPVGVFTSGGLDSALLAALAARHLGPRRVRTFSVGFPERSYDERAAARRLARDLGTPHVEVVADRAALARARDRVRLLAEPIADPALLPTLVLADAAKSHVTVALVGEGADELFGGYPTYLGHRWAESWSTLPSPLRAVVRRLVGALPVSHTAVSLEFLLKRFVSAADASWRERHVAWYGTGLPRAVFRFGASGDAVSRIAPDDPVAAAMRFDLEVMLRDRLLVKLDRAGMLASLETRAPYLARSIRRAAQAIPARRHVGFRHTKRVLREVARPLVPSYILRRRKRGLSVPVSRWLLRGLGGEVDRLLGRERLVAQGLLCPHIVARLVAEHRAGRADHGRALWTLLTLQDWIDHWGPEVGG